MTNDDKPVPQQTKPPEGPGEHGPQALFRYLDEQEFRFNKRGLTDSERFARVTSTVVGRRLTYAQLIGA